MLAQLAYYTQQSPMSDPGRDGDVLVDLPADVAGLVRVVQGVTVHVFWAEPGLRAGDEIQNYIDGRAETVRLAA